MSEDALLLEGPVKHRDGKKWKSRWCVVRRLSPVADSVELSLYSSCPTGGGGGGGARLKAALSLQRWLGALCGHTLDQQSHTLSLLCADVSLLLALPSRRALLQWAARLDALLGAARRYDVALLGGPTPQPAVLLLQGGRLALAKGQPPSLHGVWEIQHLRRFGVVEGRFAWEGGALSGGGAGAHCVAAAPGDVARLQRDVALAAHGLLPAHYSHHPQRRTNNTECASPVSSRASDAGSLRRGAVSRSASPCRGMPRCVSCAAGFSSVPFSASWTLAPPRPRRPAHLPLTCRGHQRDELCSAPSGSYDNYDVPRVPSIDAEGEYYDTPRRLHAILAGGGMSRSVTAGALGARCPSAALYATIDRSRKRHRLAPQHYENSEFAHSLRLYENARDLLASPGAGPVLPRAASAEYLPMRPLPPSPRRAPPLPCSRACSDPLLLGDDVTRCWPAHAHSNRHSSSSADSGVVCVDPPAPRAPRRCRSCSLSPPPRPPPPRPAPCSAEAAVPLHPGTGTHPDTRSTSSATSDLSDCFETMSLSSHSSLEANRSSCRNHAVPTISSLGSLRPRSGREYARPPPPSAPCSVPPQDT